MEREAAKNNQQKKKKKEKTTTHCVHEMNTNFLSVKQIMDKDAVVEIHRCKFWYTHTELENVN